MLVAALAAALGSACAKSVPTLPTRVVQIDVNRAIELAVGERVRIDAPSAALNWTLSGGDQVVTIAPGAPDTPGSPIAYWILTGRQPGAADLTLDATPHAAGRDLPGGGPPAPPQLTFTVRVRANP